MLKQMQKIKFLIGIAFGVAFFSVVTRVSASEGTFELRSTSGEDTRCFVASLQMQDLNYRILASCRNLIYPASENIFSYMLWATPSEGGNPIKLGPLGFGKAEFKTNKAFSELYVTTEQNPNTRTPAGTIVMRGILQPISFLERATTPTPAPQGQREETPSAQGTSTTDKLLLGLKRAGLVSLLALVAVIALVFVVTRGRG